MPRDAALEEADQAGREDDICFQEVIEQVRNLPLTTDAEKAVRDMLCDKLAYAVAKLKPDTRQMIAEDVAAAVEKL